MSLRPSPTACDAFIDGLGDAGDTDCPEGCTVEPDGHCTHGFIAAEESLFHLHS